MIYFYTAFIPDKYFCNPPMGRIPNIRNILNGSPFYVGIVYTAVIIVTSGFQRQSTKLCAIFRASFIKNSKYNLINARLTCKNITHLTCIIIHSYLNVRNLLNLLDRIFFKTCPPHFSKCNSEYLPNTASRRRRYNETYKGVRTEALRANGQKLHVKNSTKFSVMSFVCYMVNLFFHIYIYSQLFLSKTASKNYIKSTASITFALQLYDSRKLFQHFMFSDQIQYVFHYK